MRTPAKAARTGTKPPPHVDHGPLSETAQQRDDARYEALCRRDKSGDGQYFYSVASTGVYCRPSCGARPPLRKNVAFHDSVEDAERAGFRACKRCRPHELGLLARHLELVAVMREQLEDPEQPKTLAALAKRAGMSPFHLQRLFKQHVGMSPRAYAAAHRLTNVSAQLRQGRPVSSALYDAGYSSSSRFYEAESGALGLTPSELRRGGQGVVLRVLVRDCSLGRVLIAASERGVCSIAFGDDGDQALHAALRARFPQARVEPTDAALSALAEQVVALIDGTSLSEDIPLELLGTVFQQKVWRALRTIPRGTTSTYAAIAAQIEQPGAVRAVGTACGDNPVAALVPCHRVLRSDGGLGGYRWGLARKRLLLERERRES